MGTRIGNPTPWPLGYGGLRSQGPKEEYTAPTSTLKYKACRQIKIIYFLKYLQNNILIGNKTHFAIMSLKASYFTAVMKKGFYTEKWCIGALTIPQQAKYSKWLEPRRHRFEPLHIQIYSFYLDIQQFVPCAAWDGPKSHCSPQKPDKISCFCLKMPILLNKNKGA